LSTFVRSGNTITQFSSPSLRSLEFNFTNLTDGTWTLYDPDSLISATSYNSSTGVNTVTFNIKAASADYTFLSTNSRWPRWYKELKIEGVNPTSDNLLMCGYTSTLVTLSAADYAVSIGACVSPTTLLSSNVQGCGSYHYTAGAQVGAGSTDYTAQVSTTGASGNNKLYTLTVTGGRHVGSSETMILSSANLRVQNNSRNSSNTMNAGQNLHEIVAIGARASTVSFTSGHTIQFKLGAKHAIWSNI